MITSSRIDEARGLLDMAQKDGAYSARRPESVPTGCRGASTIGQLGIMGLFTTWRTGWEGTRSPLPLDGSEGQKWPPPSGSLWNGCWTDEITVFPAKVGQLHS